MDLEKRYLKTLDWTIILILAGLGVFSYLGISGSAAGVDKAHQQVMWYIIGFIVLGVMLLFDYRLFHNMSYVFLRTVTDFAGWCIRNKTDQQYNQLV